MPVATSVPLPERITLMADLRAWAAAIRGLKENPITLHLRTAEQRRMRKRSRLERSALPVVLGILVLFGAGLAASRMLGLVQWSYIDLNYAYIGCAALMVLYLTWLAQGVYKAVLAALSVLGYSKQHTTNVVLDDALALTQLTDYEIIAGIVSALLPPLRHRLLGGIAAFNIFLIVALGQSYIGAFQFHPYYSYSSQPQLLGELDFGGLYSVALISIIVLTLVLLSSGILNAIALLLIYISLGRGIPLAGMGGTSAFIVTAGQVIAPVVLAFTMTVDTIGMKSAVFEQAYVTDYASSLIHYYLCLALLPVMGGFCLGLARRSPGWRSVLVSSGPIIVVGLIALVQILMLGIVMELPWPGLYYYNILLSTCANNLQAWGGLSLVNVSLLAPMHALIYATDADLQNMLHFHTPVHEIMRFVTTLAVQGVLIWILAFFAREAVRARRARSTE